MEGDKKRNMIRELDKCCGMSWERKVVEVDEGMLIEVAEKDD